MTLYFCNTNCYPTPKHDPHTYSYPQQPYPSHQFITPNLKLTFCLVVLIRVRPEQILLQRLKFNSEGYLDDASKRQIQKLMRKPRSSQQKTSAAQVPVRTKPRTITQPSRPSKRASYIAKDKARSPYGRNTKRPITPAATAPKPVPARYNLRRRR